MALPSADIIIYGRQSVAVSRALSSYVSGMKQGTCGERVDFHSAGLSQLFHFDTHPYSDYSNSKNAQVALLLETRLSVSALVQRNPRLFNQERTDYFDLMSDYLRRAADFAVKNADTGAFHSLQSECSQTLNQLDGDFRFAVSDNSTHFLFLATSSFNPQTLFYAELEEFPGNYVISHDVELILPLVTPKVCKTALSFWLAGRPDPNRSLFNNVHQVPQGGMVLLSPDKKPQLSKFWDINPVSCEVEKAGLPRDYQKRLSSLLEESVSESVSAQYNNDARSDDECFFSQLSGGMDSTTVSAIACQFAKQRGMSMHTVSHTYANTNSADERDNIHAMISRCSFTQSHFIELDKYADYRFKDVYPTHPQSPGMVLSPKYHQEAALLQGANASLLLTGNGGDEMFWGHSLAYFDRLTSGEWGVVAEVINSARKLKLPVFSALRSVFLGPMKQTLKSRLSGSSVEQALAAISIPPWLTGEAKARLLDAEQRPNPFEGDKHNLAHYARYEGIFQTSTFNAMRSYQAVFDKYGLKVQHPLFNKHIAQFSFDVPQKMHISGEYPKLLLRQTMSDHLPDQVCWNRSKTVFDEHFAKLLTHNQDEIRGLLAHEGLADLGLIDNTQILAAFDNVMASKRPSSQVDLLYAILVQSWYQTHIEN